MQLKIQDLNEKMGLTRMAVINIEADGTYNNRLNSGVGETPTQPAIQATYLVADNITDYRLIINVNVYSKKCSCRGKDANGVAIHVADCSANLSLDAVIGNEGLYLQNAISQINEQGVSIEYVTLDGDSNSNTAVRNILQTNDPSREIKVFHCTLHLTQSMHGK